MQESVSPPLSSSPLLERHYKPSEIAEAWQMSEDSIRRIFQDEPGVLKIGEGTHVAGRKYVRRRFKLRIPESVLARVRERLLNKRPAAGGSGTIHTVNKRRELHAG